MKIREENTHFCLLPPGGKSHEKVSSNTLWLQEHLEDGVDKCKDVQENAPARFGTSEENKQEKIERGNVTTEDTDERSCCLLRQHEDEEVTAIPQERQERGTRLQCGGSRCDNTESLFNEEKVLSMNNTDDEIDGCTSIMKVFAEQSPLCQLILTPPLYVMNPPMEFPANQDTHYCQVRSQGVSQSEHPSCPAI